MGYTSGTAMEDRGLRDIERWRDKIEVRLDNRQVFFLFFGSALVACMLFVLGVIVGKRLESRGRAVSPEIEDPLALLDKVATSPRLAQSGVTFPQALFGTANKASVDKHAKTVALAKPGEGNALAPAATAPAVEGKPAPAKPAAKPESKPAEAALQEKLQDKSQDKAQDKAKDKANALAPSKAKPTEAKPTEAKPAEAKPAEVKESKPAVIPTVAAAGDSKSKGRYTLQLSSFQDKSEAEAFAKKFEGERPYMVASEIPGKGTWYRVRVGDYASSKDALAAKQSFEKKHSAIAYVTQK
ncbi:MAG TPA: SPOR domain-containing protein [Polyangia bacterium]